MSEKSKYMLILLFHLQWSFFRGNFHVVIIHYTSHKLVEWWRFIICKSICRLFRKKKIFSHRSVQFFQVQLPQQPSQVCFLAVCVCLKYFLHVRVLAQRTHCSPGTLPDHIFCSLFKYPSLGMILFLLSPSSSFMLSITDISLRILEYASISLSPFLLLSSLPRFILAFDLLFSTRGFHDDPLLLVCIEDWSTSRNLWLVYFVMIWWTMIFLLFIRGH